MGLGNTHILSLQTDTTGAISGTVRVQSGSEAAANPDQSNSVSFDVLDHARPSFSALVEQTSLTLDFGMTDLDHPVNLSLQVTNLITTMGFSSALDLDQLFGSGDTQAFSLPVQLFSNLAAGSSKSFELSFDPTEVGEAIATYRFLFSDENLAGEQHQEMSLTLRGVAIPEVGAIWMVAMGLLLFSSREFLRHFHGQSTRR